MYVPLSQLTPNSPQVNSPLTYCLSDGLDIGFSKGYTSFTQGPRSRNCQAFMAQYCANQWDGYCQYYFDKENQINQGGFTNKLWPNLFSPIDWGNQTASRTTGNQFLRNVLITKYCVFPNGQLKWEPFDPTFSHSPLIALWENPSGHQKLIPVCNRIDPKTIDQDTVMNMALDNVQVCGDILINIFNTCKREGIDLRGTRLGELQQRYFANMAKQLQQKQR
jgi:hypothetical protein